MRFLLYTLPMLFFSVCAKAQTEKDSIYLFDYQKEIYVKNFLSHNLSAPQNFGDVSLNYNRNVGNRKLAQQAQTNQVIDFYALGANQLGDFRISGDFLFNKVLEDSLSYGQRNDIDEWSTFNYYATKAGKYERQNYKANLTLSYKVNKVFQPFFNVNYLSHWTTGSVDPRFESKKFEMKYNPGLIVNLNETSNVGLKAILGKGRENSGVSYKNKNYNQSLVYPDRIHYLNFGYGFISIKDTVNTRKYSKILGGELSAHMKLGALLLDLDASMERKKEDNSNDLKSTSIYRKRGVYYQDTYTANAMLQSVQDGSHHLLMLNSKYIAGKDGLINFSPTFNKVNYQVDYLEAKLGYLYSTTKERNWNYDLGIDLHYFSIDRKDYASFIAVSNTFAHIAPKINVRAKLSEGDFLQFGFNPKLILDLNNAINYSVNSLNNYIQGVVFWDYDYYRTNAYQLNWNAKWTTTRISSQYMMGIKANYSLENSFGTLKEPILSSFPAKAKRNMFSIGLFLNL